MKLEQQVVSLELSKQLKEAGYPQEGLWWWNLIYVSNDKKDWKLQSFKNGDYGNIVAPTVAELGEALPKIVESVIEIPIQFEIMIIRPTDCRAPQWDILYISPLGGKDVLVEIGEDTLANAMAKMWLYLKKEGLI